MLSNNRPKALPKFEREFFGALSEVDTERVEDGDFSRLLSDILNRINLPYEPKTLLDCDNVSFSNRIFIFHCRKLLHDWLGLMGSQLKSSFLIQFNVSLSLQPPLFR